MADGASLIYTTPFLANSLQSLIHSSLGIHSLLKRQSLKHNVIDRDKILVPSNWDSWGKIRIIREGFDMEGVSTAWSIEIQDPPELLNPADETPQHDSEEDGSSAVAIFEQTIKDPRRDYSIAVPGRQQNDNKVEVETSDMQTFLSKQSEILENQKQEEEKDRAANQVPQLEMSPLDNNGRVNEYIGPVEYNKDGISVDVDASLQGIKVSIPTHTPLSASSLTIYVYRSVRPIDCKKRRPWHPPATRKRTIKPWPTSSPGWSGSQPAVLARTLPHDLFTLTRTTHHSHDVLFSDVCTSNYLSFPYIFPGMKDIHLSSVCLAFVTVDGLWTRSQREREDLSRTIFPCAVLEDVLAIIGMMSY